MRPQVASRTTPGAPGARDRSEGHAAQQTDEYHQSEVLGPALGERGPEPVGRGAGRGRAHGLPPARRRSLKVSTSPASRSSGAVCLATPLATKVVSPGSGVVLAPPPSHLPHLGERWRHGDRPRAPSRAKDPAGRAALAHGPRRHRHRSAPGGAAARAAQRRRPLALPRCSWSSSWPRSSSATPAASTGPPVAAQPDQRAHRPHLGRQRGCGRPPRRRHRRRVRLHPERQGACWPAARAIWLSNIIAFALWFWNLDRGGPAARAAGRESRSRTDLPRDAAPAARRARTGRRRSSTTSTSPSPPPPPSARPTCPRSSRGPSS